MELGRFTTLTFDCYGTLIDWETGILDALRTWRRRAAPRLPDDRLLELFGAAEIAEEQARPEALYPEILAATLRRIARALNADLSDAEASSFARSVPDWPAFPDAPGALADLKRHFRLAVLSNVDRASFAGSSRRLGVPFDLVVTAQDAGSYKPDLGNFRRLLGDLAAMGVAQDQVLHVAQSLRHDIEPAREIGLATVWVDRRHGRHGFGATAPPLGEATPDLRVRDLAELVEIHRAQTRRLG